MEKFVKKGLNSGYTYEYECRDCGKVFTQRRPMDDRDKLAKCESCGSRKTLRKMGFSGFNI